MSCGTDLLDQTIASCDCLVVRSLSHFARQFVSECQRGKQLIFTYFKGQQIGTYDVVSTCFLWYSLWFIAWFAYQFCSLFKSVSFSEFLRKFVVEILGVQTFCFVLFSEPRLRYFEFAINWHFKLIFTMCSTKKR